jgi:hypothetical protein
MLFSRLIRDASCRRLRYPSRRSVHFLLLPCSGGACWSRPRRPSRWTGDTTCMRRSWWPRIGRARPPATRRRPTRRPRRGRAWSTSEADYPPRAGRRVADPFRSPPIRLSLSSSSSGSLVRTFGPLPPSVMGRSYLRPAGWLVRHARYLCAHATLASSSFLQTSASPKWASYRNFLATNFSELRKAEFQLPRIYLPRTWVNKG